MIELFLILIGVFVSLFVSVVLFIYSRRAPINEMFLLSITFFAIAIFLASHIPALYLDQEISLLIQRSGFFLGQMGVLCGSLSIILPNFKTTYRSILIIIITSGINFASAIYNGLSIGYLLVSDYVRIDIHPIGASLWVLSFIVFGILILRRITEVSRIVKDRPNPFADLKLLSIMLLVMIPGIGIMLLTPLFPDIPSPGFIYTIPLSLCLIYFIYAFSKDKAFFFITPASFDAIIITQQDTGLALYSANFIPGLPAEQLIGGLFAALDISLQETIKSALGLTEINFGDKVILLARGQWVTCLMIVSEKNFVTSAIAKFATREFERKYWNNLILIKEAPSIDEADFEGFNNTITSLRSYIPL
ncbi:MAG: hypothetical protein ACFFDI_29940 [Promethearchaeota archaeon]